MTSRCDPNAVTPHAARAGLLTFRLPPQVSTALPIEKFAEWERNGFAPEEDFLTELKNIEGISNVETQNITFMKM